MSDEPNDRVPSQDAIAEEGEHEQQPACECGPDDSCTACVPCDVCREDEEECGCDGDGCYSCDGSGYRIPEHCCDCGGSPYCVKCHTCGVECIGECRCPVTVQLSDGGRLVL
ncbi:hypothetical protein [Nonomuraea typhae]|uniref:hypothetical protein n=1 Tax=Nonomuraea typhae TaxID=2603600 RepID=UPI0012F92548|nr:hypothetical protein [Nonomuraea typhae]